MAALQEISENWDDDFEFQEERRKLSTATAKSEATENWDDDFEDSRQSPKKIIQRHREQSWDDEDDDDEEEYAQFPLFAEEDRTVTAKSRRAALARLSTPGHPPRSPTSSVFSVPTTIQTYSSTAHLCPTNTFAFVPPSPPIHKERERRRLRKKSRPKPQAVFELVEFSSQERSSFPEVDLPRPCSRRSSRSDPSINERPPLIVTAVADTSIEPSSGPVTIPQTPTKGTALLSRIGSVKKWGVRRKRGDSTADANESPIEREPNSKISKWDPRRRRRGDSTTAADTILTGSRTEQDTSQPQSTAHLPTPGKGRRRGGSIDAISNDRQNGSDSRLTSRASSLLSSYQPRQQEEQQERHPLPPLPPPPPHDKSSHLTIQSQPQLPAQQQRAASSNWFFRSASKSGNNTITHTNASPSNNIELESIRSSPSAGLARSASSRSRSRVKGERYGDGNPIRTTSTTFYSRTPNGSRTDLTGHRETSVNRKMSGKGKDSFIGPSSGNSKLPVTTPTKLLKRKSFGFVHLGKGFGGHRGGGNEVMGESGGRKANEDDGKGKQDATKAENQKDRIKYAGLGLGHAGVTGDGGGESTPKIEMRTRRSSSRLIMDRDKETKDEEPDGVENETLVVTPSTFTLTSSFSRDNGADGVGAILPLPPLSPSKLSPGQSPSQTQQSVSLGRSAVNVGGSGSESTGLSLASGSGSGAGGALPRRNSLGDLKIPARISQAQVGLRRDLGMVREFASNVEQLKGLQNTYNALVVEVQALLDTHVRLRQLVPQPVGKSPLSVSSSNFFAQLKSRPKSRVRSNTVGSTTPDVMDSLSLAVPSSQAAYKTLVETFWNINSKYKVSWECAELLIELGSGGGGGDSDGVGVGVMSTLPSATSVTALVIQQHLAGAGGDGKTFNLKGGKRTITLTGDESNHSPSLPLSPTAHNEPQTLSQSQPSSAVVSIAGSSSMPGGIPSTNATSSGGPPLASPPRMSWRASTGRHDLSQRQLVLLREMLNTNGGTVDSPHNEGGLRPPPPHFILPEDPELHPSPLSPHPSSCNQFVNRDWRWGDAMNSTVTLSEEQESGFGDGEMEKVKKRRSGRLGMNGIRDMLRSLKKGHVEEPQQIGNSNPGEVESGRQYHHHHGRLPNTVALALPMMHSTTSLNTQSSISSRGQAQAQQQRNHLPIPRIPSHVRRRRRSSTGPESMRSSKGPAPASFNPSSFSVPKPSPRRPSLASIFRIGSNKTKPAALSTGVGTGVVEDPSSLSPAFSASEHDLLAAQCSSGITGAGCGDSNSTGEEEYWDRLDSASDLDAAAAKAPGIVEGAHDVSATVRGRGRVKNRADERKKTGVSPYLQNRSSHENDQHNSVPPLPASSSSTGLGNLLARHSIIPKRSFSASQPNILGTGGGDGQRHASSRLSRHSNFDEQLPMDTASVELPASLRISSSKSGPPQSKLPSNFRASSTASSSRPSSSRSTKIPNAKLGFAHSMPPILVAPSLPHGQQPSALSSLPDPKLGMIMTPENIKPLLENAKEVHVQLHECIVEIRALIEEGAAAIGHAGAAQARATC